MALHEDLPIYKTGYELVSVVIDVKQQIPRDFKHSIGRDLHDHCMRMLSLMAMANGSQGHERAMYIRELLAHLHAAKILLRVCFEKHWVGPKLWGRAVQLLQSIGAQGGGWLKSAKNKAPAV